MGRSILGSNPGGNSFFFSLSLFFLPPPLTLLSTLILEIKLIYYCIRAIEVFDSAHFFARARKVEQPFWVAS